MDVAAMSFGKTYCIQRDAVAYLMGMHFNRPFLGLLVVSGCLELRQGDHVTTGGPAPIQRASARFIEPFFPAIDIITGGSVVLVYSCVKISRTVAVVVALLMTAATTNALAREFRAADTQSEDYPTVQALRYMGRLIEERSGGRLQIRVFHSRQLGEEKETIEQTRAGAIDLNRTNVALIGSFVPAMNVLAMPFLFRSTEHLQKVLDGPIGNEILGSFEPYGFVGLAFYDSGARSVYNSVRPIRSIADMKGLRLRVQQSELMSDMIRALGAEPIELPYGQVRTGLATKLIDGAENNWPSFVTTDHYKYAGHYTLTEHTMSPEVLVMSRKAWDSLSEEDRTIFREAALQSSRFMRERWKDLEEQSRRQAAGAGVTIVTDFDRKPFEAAMAPLYAKAQRDPAAAQLIERIRKVD
jgi:tripartite ATP-independent transporter DctP family solute receptor